MILIGACGNTINTDRTGRSWSPHVPDSRLDMEQYCVLTSPANHADTEMCHIVTWTLDYVSEQITSNIKIQYICYALSLLEDWNRLTLAALNSSTPVRMSVDCTFTHFTLRENLRSDKTNAPSVAGSKNSHIPCTQNCSPRNWEDSKTMLFANCKGEQDGTNTNCVSEPLAIWKQFCVLAISDWASHRKVPS